MAKRKEKALKETASRYRVRAYRQRMRARGMRLVQMWLPDTSTPAFKRRAHLDSLAIAICPCTSDAADVTETRVRIEPSPRNGLRAPSYAMADKVSTVLIGKIGRRIGRLDGEDLARIDRALILFLGLADRR
jgi:mRNA interferase MazF